MLNRRPDTMADHEIISRAEAKARGLKRYFTGKSCVNGHVSERMLSGNCIECHRRTATKRAADQRAKNPDKERERNARYHKNNADKIRERKARWRTENRDKVLEMKRIYRANNADKIRDANARWRAENADKVRANADRHTREISKSYVSIMVGLPVSKIPDDLYELKRQQLEINRLEAELKREIKELTNEQ